MCTLILLSSCGTTSKKKTTVNVDKKSMDEFYWIENEDFTPTDEIVYRPANDNYDIDTEVPNALSRETMVQATPMELKVLTESKDPISQSVAFCYQKKFDQAFKLFDENYAKYKNHPGYWNQIGTCYMMQQEFRKAILYYHRARIKGKVSYAPAMNNLGVIYVHQQRWQEALEAFKRASKANNRALTPKLNMAHLYIRFGQFEKARRLLIQMKSAHSDDPTLNAMLGTIALYKKNYQQAIMSFNFIPNKLLWRADYSLNYALSLYLNGDKDKAREVFARIDRSKLGPLSQYYIVIQQRIKR
jgi:tetratricopeptide (TPR) repeat protein